MDDSVRYINSIASEETKESMIRMYKYGATPIKMRIKRCSNPKYWYAGMVGSEIMVHYFVTFGAYDLKGRFFEYWDLEYLQIK